MTLVDAHVHVDGYGDGWPVARAEMRGHGIVSLAVSMDVASYRASVALSREEPSILPSFGIHPWNAPAWARRLHELEELVDGALMLGEVGLDRRFVKDEEAFGPQEEVFTFFLDAARRTGKILNLHTSGAEALIAERMRDAGGPLAVVHWYNGPMRPLAALTDLGAYFSVGVEVLRSDRIARVARRIPLDRLLSETDNPGGWAWLEGREGRPALLERVVERLAEVRAMDRDDMADLLEANARRLLAAGGVPWPA
ncbi:MAG TPA: TatD family hydrolase [Longimicrobiales bacterium]|nr:TatD family hydrolase [Longimicrobiales bacterium]